MTRQDLEQLNRNRVARGQRPLTWMESPGKNQKPLPPMDTAYSRLQPAHLDEKYWAKPPVPKAKRPKRPRGPSHLEEKFIRLWQEAGGPELVPEFRFCKERRWRADFCHERSRTLIEIEGGAFCGRHTKAKGFLADAEKYLAAWLAGWSVVRLTAPQLTRQTITAVALRLAIR